ncbi:uncharacterized protein LOC108086294 [Drosophila ficusphila]|uniref:uncharacterized protein LOC108086294 n=1 Tax=Drosophila ficusphila TaxID=30025 RepID=UPI0007E7390A|nr:uncharacterized protein LOC108086294 [Drosophila ficusphila]
MKLRKYQCVCLVLFICAENAWTSCLIDQAHLLENFIYLNSNNGVFDIQRSDIVANDKTVYLLCRSGLHPTSFHCGRDNDFHPPLSTARCSSPRASVVPMPDTSCLRLYSSYAVGFYYNGHFMELFRDCIDRDRMSVQHSIYKVHRYINSAPRPSSTYFNRDGFMSPQLAAAYKRKVSEDCLTNILGGPQQNCVFDRGHVTPNAGFIFSELRRSTDRYINVFPQNSAVNIGNWKNVEAWVGKLVTGHYDSPHRTYDLLKVCTGVLGQQQLEHTTSNSLVDIYLAGNQIPVAKWSYKIVGHLSGDKWVMLTHNQVARPTLPEINQVCINVKCPDGLKEDGVGHTVCCEPYDFIQRNVAHLTGVC